MLNIFMLFYCIALKGKANEAQAKPNRDHAKGICEIGGETPVTPGMKVPCHCRRYWLCRFRALLKPKSYYVLHLTPK